MDVKIKVRALAGNKGSEIIEGFAKQESEVKWSNPAPRPGEPVRLQALNDEEIMTGIQYYLLPVQRTDWHQLLAKWSELIPADSTPWLLSRFGELFLEQSDRKIGMLQVSGFQYQVVAEDKHDFEDWIADPDKVAEWFLAPLVDNLVSRGKSLSPGQCYSFITPLGLGGQLIEENVMLIPIDEHFRCFGDIFQQIKELPDGSQIKLKIVE